VSIDRDELMAERDFLLKSLDDLDAELVAGNIDPDTYRVLHDDYTARASKVIQSLDDGKKRSPSDELRVSPLLRFLTIGGVVVFCIVVAVLVAKAAGERHPGQTITGNGVASPNAPTSIPNTYSGHIAAARALMAQSDLAGAVEEFSAAASLDPSQPEPLAYRGWISALVANQVTDPSTRTTLLDRAKSDLDRAIQINPRYPDAYFFKGYMLYSIDQDAKDAIKPLQTFLALAPQDHPMRPQVLQVLAQAEKAK
jgi:tetratricopeptide (TPR) repeat protein